MSLKTPPVVTYELLEALHPVHEETVLDSVDSCGKVSKTTAEELFKGLSEDQTLRLKDGIVRRMWDEDSDGNVDCLSRSLSDNGLLVGLALIGLQCLQDGTYVDEDELPTPALKKAPKASRKG